MLEKMFSELRKALETTGDGAALLPYDLDDALHEELLSLQPLAQLLNVAQAEGKTHEYTVRSSHPLGWFEGESTSGTAQNSVYARKTVMLKILRIWGEVTGFAQAVDEKFIDALEAELEGSVEGMANTMEFGALWGASDAEWTGDAYQFTGLIPYCLYYAPENVVDAGGDKIALADLDAAIAKIAKFRQTRKDPRMMMMGMEMKQVVDGLQTKVQLPLRTQELADGKIVMASYMDTPIFETDYLTPASSTSSPDDFAAAIAAGGSLADGDYDYKISSVTAFGEQVASAATGAVTSTDPNHTADLTWTADDDAYLYMIWRQDGGAGDYQLLDIIPALTYDATGKVNGTVEAYSDDGSLTPKAVTPLAAGEENIVVFNRNPRRGATWIGLVDDMGRKIDRLLSFVELARVKDAYSYLLKGYLALRVPYPNLISIIRHAKRA